MDLAYLKMTAPKLLGDGVMIEHQFIIQDTGNRLQKVCLFFIIFIVSANKKYMRGIE